MMMRLFQDLWVQNVEDKEGTVSEKPTEDPELNFAGHRGGYLSFDGTPTHQSVKKPLF
jgi:hypothetical protein